MTRRQLLSNCGTAAAGTLLAPAAATAANFNPDRPLRVLVAGGHPGDPEAGCGGTIARFVQRGHQVTALYLTRGEAGIPGNTAQEAGAIRSAEAQAACKVLGSTALFAEQLDRGNRSQSRALGRLSAAHQGGSARHRLHSVAG
jgi:LmbE family N-acetylglucosaminyl deacetylase